METMNKHLSIDGSADKLLRCMLGLLQSMLGLSQCMLGLLQMMQLNPVEIFVSRNDNKVAELLKPLKWMIVSDLLDVFEMMIKSGFSVRSLSVSFLIIE